MSCSHQLWKRGYSSFFSFNCKCRHVALNSCSAGSTLCNLYLCCNEIIFPLKKEEEEMSCCPDQLKFKCMWHVLLKYLFLLYLKKLIRTNELLSLSAET